MEEPPISGIVENLLWLKFFTTLEGELEHCKHNLIE